MPAKFLMSWNERDRAWYKMHNGNRKGNYVTCAELGAEEPTKQGSYQLANAWWLKRLAALGEKPKFRSPFESTYDGELLHDPAFGVVPPLKVKTSKAKTISANVEEFLASIRGESKPQTFKEIKTYLKSLTETDFLAGEMSVETITELTVTAHRKFLKSGSQANDYKNKRLGFFRRFVNWLYDENLIRTLPRNLKSKEHRFKVAAKAVKTWDNVADTIEALPTRYKLWALLGLNCGMTQVDLGALDWNQISLQKKTLTRKRIKLEEIKNAPTVTYQLWPETLELLKALPGRSGLVFTTEEGVKMYDAKFDGDDETKKDLFSTYWNRMEPKPSVSLGKFRNIGATALKTKALYRGFVDLYLANVPDSIADRHYAAESDEPFFEALVHIRKTILGKE